MPRRRPPAFSIGGLLESSAYGDRVHCSIADSVEELTGTVGAVLSRRGDVVIPTCALARAREILNFLRQGAQAGRLPGTMRVFIDSPQAIAATDVFRAHPEALAPAEAAAFAASEDLLAPPGVQCTRDRNASRTINDVASGAVVLAGSGMATGGRVLYHLRRELPRSSSAVVFVGFAADGTPARQIIGGAHSIRLLGEPVAVRASVHAINGFSAHADRDGLLAWHGYIKPARTFLVRGEPDTMRAFAAQLPAGRIDMPASGQGFDLGQHCCGARGTLAGGRVRGFPASLRRHDGGGETAYMFARARGAARLRPWLPAMTANPMCRGARTDHWQTGIDPVAPRPGCEARPRPGPKRMRSQQRG